MYNQEIQKFSCSQLLSKLANQAFKMVALQSTPDNLNLQGKLKKVGVVGSSSYRG